MRQNYYITSIILMFAFISTSLSQIESNTEVTVHNKSPKQIYHFLTTLTPEKYLLWHKEHKEFKAIKTTPEILGSIFYFNDFINSEKVENSWTVVQVDKDKKLIMKSSKFSVSMVIQIELTEVGNNTLVKHQLKVGKSMTGWLVKLFFTEQMIKDLQRHVQEEFTNLEWVIP